MGEYFKNIEKSLTTTKTTLQKIVSDMKEKGNSNAEATDVAVKKLIDDKLDKIIKGANAASEATGTEGGDLLGNVAATNAGAAGTEVEKLANGIKAIVDVVLQGKGKGDANAGDNKGPAQDGGEPGNARADTASTHGDARHLFATDNAGVFAVASKAARDASKAVAAVTGADILQAIAKEGGDSVKLANNSSSNNAGIGAVATNAKDATIAGGIALRAMAKGGKFSGPTVSAKEDVATAVKGAAVSSVNKALSTLTIAIRKTIDEELKKVKEAMKINPEDTPVITEAKN